MLYGLTGTMTMSLTLQQKLLLKHPPRKIGQGRSQFLPTRKLETTTCALNKSILPQ